MKAILSAVVVIIALASAAFVVVLRSQGNATCAPVIPLAQSRINITSLDENAGKFASTTAQINGRSTEGGTQTTFTDNGMKKIVE